MILIIIIFGNLIILRIFLFWKKNIIKFIEIREINDKKWLFKIWDLEIVIKNEIN